MFPALKATKSSYAHKGSTLAACVMLVGLVVTVGFFICGMLALPVALLCAIGEFEISC